MLPFAMNSLTQPTATALSQHASETVTEGIRILVEPTYLALKSKPALGHWVFGYRVTITNESADEVRLTARQWTIVDADGDVDSVSGEGVVGQQPVLRSGESFVYSSFAQLETSWGTMEGAFAFERLDGATLRAAISRFYLVSA